ncbi:MAG: trypsin-like peptidase domain-containing protein [Clostridium sp.]|uniref:S1C family serine protease n=1 Tax=Butyribacter sp. TaxID=2822465 RepID=UPI002A9615B8|nr:trypsin-like peptidase domain-containing protein [Clostridium sp.]MDY5181939.1 trypsin-like peptidase domain-containing protein [Butyribacter sp.]
MRKNNFLKITTYAAVFGLIGGMSFEGTTYISNKYINKSSVESSKTTSKSIEKTSTLSSTSTNTSSSDGVSGVSESVLPSIVAIDVKTTQTSTDVFGRTYEQDASGSGSGIIVAQDSKNVYIATNNHVVADTSSVSVTFNDKSVYSATVKGTDSDSDLAVVEVPLSKLSADTLSNIKVATLGDSDKVKVGTQAIAIGNALGYGTSVTVGYISAKDREVSGEDNTMKLLQTDAAINPGNSGGALVDSSGAVIGINSSKYADTSVEGMGFAIPINTAIPIINDIVKAKTVSEDEQAYLGITGTNVTSEYAQYYNLPEGIYVSSVTSGSPADKAGIKKGDVIVKYKGKDVTTMDGLQEKMALCKAGDKVEITVKRADNGEYKSVTCNVTLGKKSDAPESTDNSSDNGNSSSDSNSGQNGSSGQYDNNGQYGGNNNGSLFN